MEVSDCLISTRRGNVSDRHTRLEADPRANLARYHVAGRAPGPPKARGKRRDQAVGLERPKARSHRPNEVGGGR
eukprot:4503812-Pyramimonas_sp.AAC.1